MKPIPTALLVASLLANAPTAGASSPANPPPSQQAPHDRRVARLRSPALNSPEVSVLSPDEARALFGRLAADPGNPFKFPAANCFARAHRMARLMEQAGVISGKVFIETDGLSRDPKRPAHKNWLRVETPYSDKGYVEWQYHVAPIVIVEEADGRQIATVLDPSIFDHPVPVWEWVDIQTRPNQLKNVKVYYRSRFYFSTLSRRATRWLAGDLRQMDAKLRESLRLQDQLLQRKQTGARLPASTSSK